MKLQIMSDLHREMGVPKNNKFVPVGDVVILAGDITTFKTKRLMTDEFGDCGKPVIFVPGNHDYYGGDFDTSLADMKEWHGTPPGVVRVLDNDYLKIDDVHFLGCTLWPNVKVSEEMFVVNGISDFRRDGRTGNKIIENISVDKVRVAHSNSVKYLDFMMSEIRGKDVNAKIVVITHFPPSYMAQEERFKGARGGQISSYFYNACDYLIEKHQPDVWVYGHTHGHISWKDGKTQVVCNQYGYYNYQTNPDFDKDFVVEI